MSADAKHVCGTAFCLRVALLDDALPEMMCFPGSDFGLRTQNSFEKFRGLTFISRRCHADLWAVPTNGLAIH